MCDVFIARALDSAVSAHSRLDELASSVGNLINSVTELTVRVPGVTLEEVRSLILAELDLLRSELVAPVPEAEVPEVAVPEPAVAEPDIVSPPSMKKPDSERLPERRHPLHKMVELPGRRKTG